MMAFRVPDGVSDPWGFTQEAELTDFPPLGTAEELADELNRRLREEGVDSGELDETSGVVLPDGVDSIGFTLGEGQVRLVLVNDPTGEVIDVLTELRAQEGWHLLDVGTGESI